MKRPSPYQAVAVALFLAAAGVALYLARYVVLTAMIGVGLGVLFMPALEWMNRKLRIPRGVAGLILILGVLLVIGGISFALGLLVSDQLTKLQSTAPQIYQSLYRELESRANEFPWLKGELRRLNPGQLFHNAGKWALGGLQTGAAALASLVLVLAISVFTAINSRRYMNGVLSAFPARRRPEAAAVMGASAKSLRAWAKAQLFDMSIVGVATALGLWAIGIDYWVVLGLLAGLIDVIPYVGPLTSAVITSLVTLGTEPDKVLWVLGLLIVIQQLEGNLLVPLIMREEASLPEVPLLILIMFMSAWFGLLGALLAAPTLAVGRTVYLMTYKPRMDRQTDVPGRDSDQDRAA